MRKRTDEQNFVLALFLTLYAIVLSFGKIYGGEVIQFTVGVLNFFF